MTTLTHDAPVVRAAGRRRSASGLGFAVLSASSFGLSGSLARGLMTAGWSPSAAVAARILIGGLVLLPVAAVQMRGRWDAVGRNLPLVLAYGAVAVAGCQLAYFNAVARMPVGVALLVEYTAPLAVVAWLWARRGQRPTGSTVLGALVGTVGLVLVLGLTGGGAASASGVLWALAAMLAAAVYFLLSAREADGLPPAALAAAGLLVGAGVLVLAGAVGAVPLAASTAPVGLAGRTVAWWLPVVLLGVVSAAVAYACGIAATRRLGARLASFVALSEVLAALLLAWLLLGEVPTGTQLTGGALILAGVVAVRRGER
jgi:drug/metabolite transporter (DMT)-like permease